MSEEAGATPATENTPAATAGTGEGTPDPREDALGDAGKALLTEMRQAIKGQNATIKDLTTRLETMAKGGATPPADPPKKTDDDPVAAIQAELAAEREKREKFESDLQERMRRDEFTKLAEKANIRDGYEADLYRLVQDELRDGAEISEVLEAQKTKRPAFFTEKRGTKGHDGSAGTGGGAGGPALTAEEARFSKALGVKPSDYADSRQ